METDADRMEKKNVHVDPRLAEGGALSRGTARIQTLVLLSETWEGSLSFFNNRGFYAYPFELRCL